MRNILYLLVFALSFSACKKESKQEEETIEIIEKTIANDGLTLIEGDFIYYEKAAVLQTKTGFFGVVLNEKTKELAEKAKSFQKENTDMVKVRVRGLIEPKAANTEGWDYIVTIKEIVSVESLTPEENEIIKVSK
ncbi:hypothetical protein [Aurantibacter sp.]|uniref:hypothetical protein n=1 Tax=Aurantibacter sp. TaxID=2807103 RepID=UPI0035C7B4E3